MDVVVTEYLDSFFNGKQPLRTYDSLYDAASFFCKSGGTSIYFQGLCGSGLPVSSSWVYGSSGAVCIATHSRIRVDMAAKR